MIPIKLDSFFMIKLFYLGVSKSHEATTRPKDLTRPSAVNELYTTLYSAIHFYGTYSGNIS